MALRVGVGLIGLGFARTIQLPTFVSALAHTLGTRGAAPDGAATFEDGWRNQLVLDAARRSHVERRWVDLAASSEATESGYLISTGINRKTSDSLELVKSG